jgi:hypothetical protein
VVWPGSHDIIRAAFAAAFAGHAPETWGDIDVTEAYTRARARAFATCPRVEVPLSPGQSVILHRHAIHGVAPWAPGAAAPPEGRMIAYFRPVDPDPARWLNAP